ncbi:hypothetical protein D3C86_1734780 [compost metagenome]
MLVCTAAAVPIKLAFFAFCSSISRLSGISVACRHENIEVRVKTNPRMVIASRVKFKFFFIKYLVRRVRHCALREL